MKDVRIKISGMLTGGAAPRAVIGKSLVLGFAATLSTLPHFHALLFGEQAGMRAFPGTGPWGILAGQSLVLFLVCLLAAMSGLAFAPRQGLQGLGDTAVLRGEWKRLVLVGALMATGSFLVFDQWFVRVAPAAYPRSVPVLISLPFKGALAEETILRLCMVTLAIGLFKRRWAGIVVISLLAPFFGVKYLRYMGLEGVAQGWIAWQLALSFAANVILGSVFVRRGLFACMVVKFVFNLKYALVVWLIAIP